jgi:hypothetical protein
MRALAALAIVTVACAPGQSFPPPEPLMVTTAGTPEAFGRGILAAHPAALLVALSAPAYVTVVRVWPHEGAELVYPVGADQWSRYGYSPRGPGPQRLKAGEHRILVPVPSPYRIANRFRATPAPSPVRAPGMPVEPCVLRPAETARPRPSQIYCYYLSSRDPLQRPQSPRHWAPPSLDAHYLVLIAADAPFDIEQVRAQIEELDLERVSGETAAQVVPQVLVGERRHWAAWIVRP